MVKRRRLEAPSSADLDRIEEEFRSETSSARRGLAPIAQVAAESAADTQTEGAEARAARARAEADAARLQAALDKGLLIQEIAVSDIDDAVIVRDRMVLAEDELAELRTSIGISGLRLPIEVFELETPGRAGERYGLLSGYRRLLAVKSLRDLTDGTRHSTIRAIVRPRTDTDAAFVSMVEENEVRAELSHFERGRIAVIAAQQGAFANTEDAVAKLYATGSKAKRSKVRSFALIFEELGDLLHFPEAISERRGLRLAAALRDGAEEELRHALSGRPPADADAEWALIDTVLSSAGPSVKDPKRGGRPKRAPVEYGWIDDLTIRTSSGIVIRRGTDSKGHILRFEGRLHPDVMENLMLEIQSLLEKP